MKDDELKSLRRLKLQEMRKRLLAQKSRAEKGVEEGKPDGRRVLDQVFTGRAWEVLNAARLQYPQATKRVEEALVQLILAGRIREKIGGEELYGFLRRLGLRVRLKTRIQVMEHGTLKSLEEKMKERQE